MGLFLSLKHCRYSNNFLIINVQCCPSNKHICTYENENTQIHISVRLSGVPSATCWAHGFVSTRVLYSTVAKVGELARRLLCRSTQQESQIAMCCRPDMTQVISLRDHICIFMYFSLALMSRSMTELYGLETVSKKFKSRYFVLP